MVGESGLTRSFFDELHSWDIQGGQMEGESMVLLEKSLMNFIVRIIDDMKWKVKVVLLEVSLMKFILRIFKEIKFKVKLMLFEVSLMDFILRISKEIKWKVKGCYSKHL